MARNYPIRLSTQVQPNKPRDPFLEQQTKQIEEALNYLLAPQSVRTVVQSVSVTTDDWVILVDATIGAVTVTLVATGNYVRPITVKKIDASANAVTIIGVQGQLIEGAASVVLAAQYDMVTLAASSGAWWEV